MLDDRIQKLMAFFRSIEEGKAVNLNEVVREYLSFFEELKERLQTATPEEKRQLFFLMNEMYTKMLAQSQRLAQRSGLSEEQLLQISENPNNFSQEQWDLLQDTKKNLSSLTKDISKNLSGPKKVEEQKASSPKEKEGPKKPRRGRSGWMKS
jgi:hypothetical protein